MYNLVSVPNCLAVVFQLFRSDKISSVLQVFDLQLSTSFLPRGASKFLLVVRLEPPSQTAAQNRRGRITSNLDTHLKKL